MKAPQLICVYGTLRKGHGNYKFLLETEKFIGEFKTEPKYTMLSNGGFPMVFLEGNTQIVCEVFQVIDQGTLVGLDRLEGYPSFYNRKEINTPWGKAWMYYIDGDVSDYITQGRTLIESGDWNEFVGIKEVEEI